MLGQVFRHPHRVVYSECTAGNHVYYGRYLDILEAARGEFFRHLGHPFLRWQEQDTLFPVIECRLRYRGAARYDDQLTVELWLERIERVRLTFASRIVGPSNQLILEASTTHACTTLHEKPKRIPLELAGALAEYLHSEGNGDAAANIYLPRP